ncbi:MAG TPA: glycosyltransferase family 2 protein [Allosphingosinicella sp.]|jgi:glycosyltransferase involved in cell wall biosynthesis
MHDNILLFIPCYNCAPQVKRVLARCSAAASEGIAEILLLDNGSSDGTVEAAVAAAPEAGAPRVTIGRNRANFGLGGSHKAAFAYAERNGFTHVITLHGDDQGDLADLSPILHAGEHRRQDACLGARFAPGARLQGYSRFRIFGNHVFNALFSALAMRRIHDLGSGLNIVGRSVFADPAVLRHSDDLRFNIYLLLTMIDAGRRLSFFPISWREDDQVSNVRMASQAMKTLEIAGEYLLRRKRFREADHREVRRADYGFDVVAAFEKGVRDA